MLLFGSNQNASQKIYKSCFVLSKHYFRSLSINAGMHNADESLKSPWCEKSERESVNQKCNQFQSANSGNENEIISRHLIKIDRLS